MKRIEAEARILELAIANRIRGYRKNLDWTLSDLSKIIGLSPGHLSQIENGDKTPPIGTLTRIAYGLGITVRTLITGETVENEFGKISIGRHKKRMAVERPEDPSDSLIQSFGFTKPDRVMGTYVVTLGTDFPGKAAMHNGQEFVYTIEGIHTFYYDGKTYILHSGDAVYFESNRPHMGCRLGKEPARVLVVNCDTSQRG